jgi:hypothetical protein
MISEKLFLISAGRQAFGLRWQRHTQTDAFSFTSLLSFLL